MTWEINWTTVALSALVVFCVTKLARREAPRSRDNVDGGA